MNPTTILEQLAQIRETIESAGLPVESISVIDDARPIPPRVVRRPPRRLHTTPLLEERHDGV